MNTHTHTKKIISQPLIRPGICLTCRFKWTSWEVSWSQIASHKMHLMFVHDFFFFALLSISWWQNDYLLYKILDMRWYLLCTTEWASLLESQHFFANITILDEMMICTFCLASTDDFVTFFSALFTYFLTFFLPSSPTNCWP